MGKFADVAEMMGNEWLYYVDPEEFEEAKYDMSWSDIQPMEWGPHTLPVYIPPHFQGDIGGDLVTKSNFEVFQEEFEDSQGDKWVALYGGHGSYGIAIRGDVDDKEILDVLAALSDYPVLSDEHMSQLEVDASDEAWQNWARSDFTSAIERRAWTIKGKDVEIVDFDEGDMGDDDFREFFETMRERANEYWEPEGDGMSIDIERIVDEMTGKDIEKAIENGAEVEMEIEDTNGAAVT